MLATKNENEDGRWKVEDGILVKCISFHSPFSIFHFRFIFFLTLAVCIAGCSPPGPRALLKGKKLLENGDYAAAVEQFKTATRLLPANAQAWNYLGVAEQHAGQSADAVTAYQRALTLDRDLVEAHYNLGLLWLEQNKFPDAKIEFTAYTLRRGNAPEGWLKLGAAQLRGGEIVSAEKSFSTALSLSSNNAEAYNGLGLARVQRNRPRDAAQFFAAAVQDHPDYAPAILNLATVNRDYLHDDKAALENFRNYLALTPRPDDWDAVNAMVNRLESSGTVVAVNPPAASQNVTPSAPAAEVRPPAVHPASSLKPPPATTRAAPSNSASRPQPAGQVQVVRVEPEPVIMATPDSTAPTLEVPSQKPPSKLNPLNWFGSGQKKNGETNVTPLPAENSGAANPQKPIKIVPPAPPTFPRYAYLSPRKPKPGDHVAASGAFTRAREAEQEQHWTDAMEWYRRAAQFDSSWFEAQYNLGVLANRLQNYPQALAAYETALALQPDSIDARYNFALTLKSAGYVNDAVNELKKILAANPVEARAHLALGNIYAQQLFDPSQARREYLKVLDLDPHNSQATDIRYWLLQNQP